MVSVDVERTSEGLRFGTPVTLFESYPVLLTSHPPAFSYSVTPDGQRFLMARQLAAATANPAETPLTVVLNWEAALKK